MRLALFALTAVLAGCANTTGVMSTGKGTYSVMHRDNGPMASLGELKANAYRDAAAFCAGQGKAMEVVGGHDVPRSLGQFPETEVKFICV